MALVPKGALVDGLRVGMVAEVNGKLGQITDFSTADGTFDCVLTDGTTCKASPGEVKVPSDLGRPGMGGHSASFDVLVAPKMDHGMLGEEVFNCLFEKGFCVLKTCQTSEDMDSAVAAMKDLGDNGKLQRFPEEVEEGYLGQGGRGKVAWMDPREMDKPEDPMLDKSDQFLSTLASVIQPYALDLMGKEVVMRTPALASLSLTDDDEPEYPPQDADDACLGQFLQTYRRTLIKIVHFIGPETTSVTLEDKDEAAKLPFNPNKDGPVMLTMEPGSILVFRTGVYAYSVSGETETLSLTTSLLAPGQDLELVDWKGDTSFLYAGNGPPGPAELEQVNVVNLSTRLMCNFDEPEAYRAGLYSSCDGSVEIPILRWDANAYYEPDDAIRQPWQTFLKHQAYVEGLELFDNKYFEITNADARIMDPMSRQVLEVGAHNLFKLGITKKISNRTPHHAGCSVGLDKDDWDRRAARDFNMEGGCNVQAIISNRFSFVFNLRGPNYVADTACSASLCATHFAKFCLRDRVVDQIEFHVAIGVHQCLMAWGFDSGGSRMNSGSCKTFNDTANGYMRGDGCSGMTLKWGELPEERDAIWRASMCNQNGKSATLTAPNGIAQGEVIMKAYQEGKMSPPESTVWNCHGTGTSLGDPIEVGAIRRIHIKEERPGALAICTNKTHTGHLEGGAAMTSLIGACLALKFAVAIPLNHFRVLNPNLEQSQFDAFINSEAGQFGFTCGNAHISSFGFGGTNGHCIMWNISELDCPDVPTLFMKRFQKMQPPEVRVNGSDPSEWEWDGPELDEKAGAKYQIEINASDPIDIAMKLTKAEDAPAAPEEEDGEDDFYCITGPFNEWDTDRMEDGNVMGLRSISLEVPESGSVEFRFLKNGDESEVIYPVVDKCTRQMAPILGPKKTDGGLEKNTWVAEGPPGSTMIITLFVCRGRRSVSWTPEALAEKGE